MPARAASNQPVNLSQDQRQRLGLLILPLPSRLQSMSAWVGRGSIEAEANLISWTMRRSAWPRIGLLM